MFGIIDGKRTNAFASALQTSLLSLHNSSLLLHPTSLLCSTLLTVLPLLLPSPLLINSQQINEQGTAALGVGVISANKLTLATIGNVGNDISYLPSFCHSKLIIH